MRKFSEPTARNLLRKPLVLGVPLPGLMAVSAASLTDFILFGTTTAGSLSALGVGGAGYAALRVLSRFARPGWEETVVFALERRIGSKKEDGQLIADCSELTVSASDTLTDGEGLLLKESALDRLLDLKAGERWTLSLHVTDKGAKLSEIQRSGLFDLKRSDHWKALVQELTGAGDRAYALYRLPVVTDPFWLFGAISKLNPPFTVLVGFQGVDASEIKRRVEHARRSNARGNESISNIDSEISFEEASLVLQGLSRGDEAVVEVSLIIASRDQQPLDEALFCEEKDSTLPLLAVTGIRRRFHRSNLVRVATACDLVPNIADPSEEGAAILRTPRGVPLYFSPQDPRLEALHWIVAGASGSGKSFFTGLVLKRMIEQDTPMSVLFVDHNRSFRRFVRSLGQPYQEPSTLSDLEQSLSQLRSHWNQSGTVTGVELSDLDLVDKKEGAKLLLARVEEFLRERDTTHPFYLVLDECWNLMRDDPMRVQRAFREYRKLNGAVIAITQSLADFLTDESGQSIFQNAPIRILLRQGEDVSRYQGILGLNSVELTRVSRLRQKKGEYSECLIKTPFLSRFGRLYPTPEEHSLLRTDTIRAELIAETRKKGGAPCAATSAQ